MQIPLFMGKTQTLVAHYEVVEKAIKYVRAHIGRQPDLDEIAEAAGLSVFHFQKVFQEWAGVSPKNFLRYATLEFTKKLLTEQHTLETAAEIAGLSAPARLHELFVKIIAMSPGEYKNGASGLEIEYDFYDSKFGKLIAANTGRGLCHLQFFDDEHQALDELFIHFPAARIARNKSDIQVSAVALLQGEIQTKISLHLKGSKFQILIWNALLHIPEGKLYAYRQIAEKTGNPGAARAVGTAIGSNPVAMLIPCHRVIRGDGNPGGYRWGLERKAALLAIEHAGKPGKFVLE